MVGLSETVGEAKQVCSYIQIAMELCVHVSIEGRMFLTHFFMWPGVTVSAPEL